MADEMVRNVQIWLNQTYTPDLIGNIDPDGITGNTTVRALTTALQIELSAYPIDGVFGKDTLDKLVVLSDNTPENTYNNLEHVIYILQGALYCKGYNPSGLDGVYGDGLKNAIKKFKTDAGLANPGGSTEPKIFKALLNMDGFVLSSKGDSNIRIIQQNLNKDYYSYMDLIPTNGIKDRKMSKALILALQVEEHKTIPSVSIDGIWGNNTFNNCPLLRRYGTVTNKQFVYILQYALYFNGYDPNGFDGGFGGGVESAVKKFQAYVGLPSDGVVGKQTWASLMISYGDKNRVGKACDTAHVIASAAEVAAIKAEGKETVGRYISGTSKKLRPEELDLLLSSGLKVFPIYQESNNALDCFSYKQGQDQAFNALKNALSYGFLEDTIIYFPVDFDASESQLNKEVMDFFRGINYHFSNQNKNPLHYQVGIYGPRQICQKISEENLAVRSFVSDMSSGFSGNIGHPLPENWNYDQIREYSITASDGTTFPIDNIVTRAGSDMGESSVNNDLLSNIDLLTLDFTILSDEDYRLVVALSRMFLTYLREENYAICDILYGEMRATRRKSKYKDKYPGIYSDETGLFESDYVYQTSAQERSRFAYTVMDNVRYTREIIIQLKQSDAAIAMFAGFLPIVGTALGPITTYLFERQQSEDEQKTSLDFLEGVTQDYFVDQAVEALEGTPIYAKYAPVLKYLYVLYGIADIISMWADEDVFYYTVNAGGVSEGAEKFKIVPENFYVRLNILYDDPVTMQATLIENIIYADSDQPSVFWRQKSIV
ncbi:MAG: DUF1906 domain-containing protein [Lacrimispora sp.]|uniref:glycoside hydrolase domain-containing protein n=1 Tax=Lacrimispora sp. TaxID=2719234 RepID=UPI0039E59417